MLAHRASAGLERTAHALLPRTRATITDPRQFLLEMGRIRKRGFAVNRGEWNVNVAGIAAPVTDTHGAVIAAIGLSGPKDRFKPAQLKQFAPLVIDAGLQISRRVGGHLPAATRR